jgi:hypothetical protein
MASSTQIGTVVLFSPKIYTRFPSPTHPLPARPGGRRRGFSAHFRCDRSSAHGARSCRPTVEARRSSRRRFFPTRKRVHVLFLGITSFNTLSLSLSLSLSFFHSLSVTASLSLSQFTPSLAPICFLQARVHLKRHGVKMLLGFAKTKTPFGKKAERR